MSKTKKVSSAGRFGPRYGRRLRSKITEIEKKQRARFKCPHCSYVKVKRVSHGIYECKKCNVKFTGGSYFLE